MISETGTFDDWRLPAARNTGNLVFETLQRRIVEGEIPHGTKLSEANIAARMGVSRTPVREALTRLVAMGLLQPAQPSGVLVVDPLADLEELVLLRSSLEGCAARLAASRATPADVNRILSLAEESGRYGPTHFEERSALNAEFHDAVLAAAHSPRLSAMASSYSAFFASPRLMRLMSPQEMHHALSDHVEIANAIAQGDGLAAEATARRHLQAAYGRSIGATRHGSGMG